MHFSHANKEADGFPDGWKQHANNMEIQRPITTASPSKVDEGPQTNPIPSMGKADEYVTQA